MARWCIGIDLGGTFIKFGLLDENRQPGGTLQLPTPRGGAEGIIAQMVEGARALMAQTALRREDLVAVGIGAPGPADLKRGVILAMPNIPGVADVPLARRVGEAIGAPACLENDANAAAYGEFCCGCGVGSRSLVLLTLGTGVGSGVIVEGQVLHGSHDVGGEFGHMIVQPDGDSCPCGQRGCLERYCSAAALGRRARQAIEAGRSSALVEVLRRKGDLDAKDVEVARKAGDALAAEVWEAGAHYLAVACVNICRILDPDLIVLAGGLAGAGEDLRTPVREHFGRLHWSLTAPRTRIELSALGEQAGVIGAAAVAWRASRQS
ncbi:MAG: ROK family protein [Phycisphaerae bacterium]|nr:ROK family protein [Phycisphaerae bacterium]